MKQYIESTTHVLNSGIISPTRGTPTVAVHGIMTRYDCSKFHPITTIKHQGMKDMTTEMEWMMKGLTSNLWLLERDCKIWNKWDVLPLTEVDIADKLAEVGVSVDFSLVDQETLSKLTAALNISDKSGELGPVYGEMMANWPTSNGETINQLDELIDGIRENPFSRRHIVSMWNPEFLPNEKADHVENIKNGKQVLPPCHMSFQILIRNEPFFAGITKEPMTDVEAAKAMWSAAVGNGHTDKIFHEWVSSVLASEKTYVEMVSALYESGFVFKTGVSTDNLIERYNRRYVDLLFTMRSNDKPLGEPYNVSNYGTLLAAVAHLTGFERGDLIHSTGNSHIYLDQLEGVDTMLSREPKEGTRLLIEDRGQRYLKDFAASDFTLEDYQSHGKVSFKVNV